MSFGQGGPQEAHGQFGPPPQPPHTPQTPPAQFPQPSQPPQTPDWAALAEDSAARDRRRKWLLLGGGALAAAAVAAIVAVAVVKSGKGGGSASASSHPSATASVSPEPTFAPVAPPSPPDPRSLISSADKDTAPLSAATFFPDAKTSVEGRTYQRVATDETADCASVTQGGLGSVLAGNGCRKMLRATYVKDGVAVTVGVAVFDSKAAADKAKDQAGGNVLSLPGPSFCRGPACRLTSNAEGRYAYFTVAGYTDGKPVPADDTTALTSGRDISTYAFARIMARARTAAAVAPRGA
ncbi:hypothetical protein ACIHFE_12100 [Streptomyces sp. NPDC052396]|uniref:hypothetical protein n=1 Tax=Streptomyces sp. NPDC052396 TaxID=3365689 RepID=UPI0037D089E7